MFIPDYINSPQEQLPLRILPYRNHGWNRKCHHGSWQHKKSLPCVRTQGKLTSIYTYRSQSLK